MDEAERREVLVARPGERAEEPRSARGHEQPPAAVGRPRPPDDRTSGHEHQPRHQIEQGKRDGASHSPLAAYSANRANAVAHTAAATAAASRAFMARSPAPTAGSPAQLSLRHESLGPARGHGMPVVVGGGEYDAWRFGLAPHHLGDVHPAAVGEPHVQQHHVGSQGPLGREGLGRTRRFAHDVEACVLQQLAYHGPKRCLVVDHEHRPRLGSMLPSVCPRCAARQEGCPPARSGSPPQTRPGQRPSVGSKDLVLRSNHDDPEPTRPPRATGLGTYLPGGRRLTGALALTSGCSSSGSGEATGPAWTRCRPRRRPQPDRRAVAPRRLDVTTFTDSFDDDRNGWALPPSDQGRSDVTGGDFVWESRIPGLKPHLLASTLADAYDQGRLEMTNVTVTASVTPQRGAAAMGVFCREVPDTDADFQWYEFVVRDGYAAIRQADMAGHLDVLAEGKAACQWVSPRRSRPRASTAPTAPHGCSGAQRRRLLDPHIHPFGNGASGLQAYDGNADQPVEPVPHRLARLLDRAGDGALTVTEVSRLRIGDAVCFAAGLFGAAGSGYLAATSKADSGESFAYPQPVEGATALQMALALVPAVLIVGLVALHRSGALPWTRSARAGYYGALAVLAGLNNLGGIAVTVTGSSSDASPPALGVSTPATGPDSDAACSWQVCR